MIGLALMALYLFVHWRTNVARKKEMEKTHIEKLKADDYKNQFELEHSRFLFFPTFVHQDPRMVKPAFRAGLTQVRAEPDKVTLRGYGEVARILEVPSRKQLETLDDLHIWDAPLLDMRFSYRPEKPLYLVVVRAWVLPQPVTIENTLEYAGCKSWVPLAAGVEEERSQPAMGGASFGVILQRVEAALA
jgi:hypothetical protein